MLIVPLCTGITLVIVMQYLINPIFGALNQAMVAFLLPPENPGAALLADDRSRYRFRPRRAN